MNEFDRRIADALARARANTERQAQIDAERNRLNRDLLSQRQNEAELIKGCLADLRVADTLGQYAQRFAGKMGYRQVVENHPFNIFYVRLYAKFKDWFYKDGTDYDSSVGFSFDKDREGRTGEDVCFMVGGLQSGDKGPFGARVFRQKNKLEPLLADAFLDTKWHRTPLEGGDPYGRAMRSG